MAHGEHGGAPSPWVVRFAGSIASGGTVLDVACGRGRHARWLEARGHRVTAIDRDATALAASGASETIVCDLETEPVTWPLPARRFDAVVVTNYLHRPLFPQLIAALAPGGMLLYETFATGNARYGRPSNPHFLLETGELLERCRALIVVAYEDGIVAVPAPASVQRLCCTKPVADGGATARHAL